MTKSETGAHHQFIAKFLAWAEKGITATTLLPHSLFRGQADNYWATHPSLARIHTALKVQQLKLMEQEVIQEFRKKNDLSKETWDDMDGKLRTPIVYGAQTPAERHNNYTYLRHCKRTR